MKKVISILCVALLILACNDDNNEILHDLSINISSSKQISNYSDFQITITELQSGQKFMAKADTQGKTTIQLPVGTYRIIAEDIIDGASSMYGRIETFTLSEANSSLTIDVKPTINSLEKSFVLDELYFNGATNGDWNHTYYEQYFTIRNIADRPLYADGLCFGVAGDYSCLETGDKMAKFLPENVIISQFYTIPGDGRKFKVNPNESLVIAFSAINHNEKGDKPKSIDLSGADVEIYVEGGMTADNPEVPNVKVDYSVFQAFHWQYSGAAPMILFRLDGDHKAFLQKNTEALPNPASMGTMVQNFVKLPTELIIDAVETGAKDEFYHKVLPSSVDKSAILVDATMYEGFKEQFVKRKEIIGKDGKTTVQDTNDSEKDFELIVGGQKNYPKK